MCAQNRKCTQGESLQGKEIYLRVARSTSSTRHKPLRSGPSPVKLLANAWATKSPISLGGATWRLRHVQRPPTTASACSIKSASSRTRAITAGSCRPPRSPSISASAWPTVSACSGCRSAAPSAWRKGSDTAIPCPGDATTFFGKVGITARALFATSCDWTQFDLGWMYTLFFVLLGVSAAIWGGWLERVGPRKAGVVAAILLVRRAADLGRRRLYPSALADVARLRHHRRRRPRPRLYLARLHAHQMVPRPPRHGDRHGHHGLRRRRHDRLAARDLADETFRHSDLGRRLGNLRGDGR